MLFDIKKRSVSNDVWLIMFAGSIFFILYDASMYGISYLLSLFISAGFVFMLVYIIFQLGLFGGADAKSLIVLSIILPTYPAFQAFGYSLPLNKPLYDIFTLSVFGNAALLTIIGCNSTNEKEKSIIPLHRKILPFPDGRGYFATSHGR